MKEIKILLTLLLAAVYTSMWWLAGVVQATCQEDMGKELIWFLPGVVTLGLVYYFGEYLSDHWNDK